MEVNYERFKIFINSLNPYYNGRYSWRIRVIGQLKSRA